jgi:hypothetical protein
MPVTAALGSRVRKQRPVHAGLPPCNPAASACICLHTGCSLHAPDFSRLLFVCRVFLCKQHLLLFFCRSMGALLSRCFCARKPHGLILVGLDAAGKVLAGEGGALLAALLKLSRYALQPPPGARASLCTVRACTVSPGEAVCSAHCRSGGARMLAWSVCFFFPRPMSCCGAGAP